MKSVLLLLVFAAPLAFQDKFDNKVFHINYKDGRSERVEVLGVADGKATLLAHVFGGTVQLTSKLSDLTPFSAYRVESAAIQPDSFDEHFHLAKRAAELGLLPQAGDSARAAVETAKDQTDAKAREQEVRSWAADTLEQWTREAISQGNLSDARHYLKLLTTRVPEQRTEEQLEALAGDVDALEADRAQKRKVERQARLDKKIQEEIERRLKPIEKRIEHGDKLQREALRKSRSTVQSSRLAEQSIEAYRTAWKEAQSLAKKYPDDKDLAGEIANIGQRLQRSAIRSALHAANVLTVQSDYKSAMDWANKVLAFDPDNAEAKEMVRTIQLAQASAAGQWGWGWRVVGPPPVPGRRQ